MAHGNQNELVNLGLRFGLFGYPEEVAGDNDNIKKTALQYIENHDHSRFVYNFSLIALNFGDQEQKVPFEFPFSGNYREELHGYGNLKDITGGGESWLTVPGNYGRIWTLETG